jgi:dihydrofolate synthase / folylpolyglutamate synthase
MNEKYLQWIEWLEARSIMPQIRPGLKHTESALKEAGILEKVQSQKVVHIAGTNGKGTTAKTLEHLLLSQGVKVGLYTSPHLVDTTERIRIGGRNILQEDLIAYCERYEDLIYKWNLSHFESLTLFSASLFFIDDPVDYAIYEIGLGGTWDATNVIPHQTSVITTLGFDHQHILGETLPEIADNKFGIIKSRNKVFHLPYEPVIESQLQAKAVATNSSLTKVTPAEVVLHKTTSLPDYFIKYNETLYPLSLPGPRAAQNMWLAVQVFESLGFDKIQGLQNLNSIEWPARMTLLSNKTRCPVYLSGDHNLQGIESLKEILKQSNHKQIKILFGLSKNRIHRDFLKSLNEIPQAEIFLTKPSFGGVEPESSSLPYNPDPVKALHSILSAAKSEDMVIVTGSLYLCGDILRASEEFCSTSQRSEA